MPDLEKWIQEQLDSGYSQQQILQSLLDSGYTEKQARPALQKVLNQRKSQTKPMISQHKGLISFLIILLIISAAAAYLYQDFRNKSGYNFPDRLGEFKLKNKTVENSTENSKIDIYCYSRIKKIERMMETKGFVRIDPTVEAKKKYNIFYEKNGVSIEFSFYIPKNESALNNCFDNLNSSFDYRGRKINKDNFQGETAILFDIKEENTRWSRVFMFMNNGNEIALKNSAKERKKLLKIENLKRLSLEFIEGIE